MKPSKWPFKRRSPIGLMLRFLGESPGDRVAPRIFLPGRGSDKVGIVGLVATAVGGGATGVVGEFTDGRWNAPDRLRRLNTFVVRSFAG